MSSRNIVRAAVCLPGRASHFTVNRLNARSRYARFHVAGPADVVGDSDGGVLDADLRRAALAALDVPRERARARALEFDRDRVRRQFLAHLAPIRRWKPDAG